MERMAMHPRIQARISEVQVTYLDEIREKSQYAVTMIDAVENVVAEHRACFTDKQWDTIRQCCSSTRDMLMSISLSQPAQHRVILRELDRAIAHIRIVDRQIAALREVYVIAESLREMA